MTSSQASSYPPHYLLSKHPSLPLASGHLPPQSTLALKGGQTQAKVPADSNGSNTDSRPNGESMHISFQKARMLSQGMPGTPVGPHPTLAAHSLGQPSDEGQASVDGSQGEHAPPQPGPASAAPRPVAMI
jgi:hypothetical protein